MRIPASTVGPLISAKLLSEHSGMLKVLKKDAAIAQQQNAGN